MKAEIVWFNDSIGYGFARTADNKDVFVHKQNFAKGEDSNVVFQGTRIEFELKNQVDTFEETLNEGGYRDVVKNHRNPRRAIKTNEKKSNRYPAAITIRVLDPRDPKDGPR